MQDLSISIVISLYRDNEYFHECLDKCLALDYDNFEVIVVADRPTEVSRPRTRIISTFSATDTSPAEKRDLALQYVHSDLCAFIDDDAYPNRDWLRNAVKYFSDDSIGAVCGPGLTPPHDSHLQKAGGAVYSSVFGSGQLTYRFVPKPARYVDDHPAYNLIIRQSVLQAIGGFNSTFYGGEDTKVCLEIIKRGMKILYAPDVCVYHHRRPLFGAHLRQVANVGLHRGFFARTYPQTSARPLYFAPAFGLATVPLLGAGLIFDTTMRTLILFGFISYYLAASALALRQEKSVLIATLVPIGILLTHLTYGAMFIKGMLTRSLER